MYSNRNIGFIKFITTISLIVVLFGISFGIGISIGDTVISPTLSTDESSIDISDEDEHISLSSVKEVYYTPAEIEYDSINSISNVVKAVSDSVVSIRVQSLITTGFNRVVQGEGAGSGVIFSEDDSNIYIITNNHVISDANKVFISIDDEKLVQASYVGSDANADLAVISVKKENLREVDISSYKVATFGDSSKLDVGEIVVAIGNSAGEGKTATLGIISAKNKEIVIENRKLNVLQTDAAINPGNSGGALVNGNAEVIGINTAKLKSDGIEGMGYSIPISEAKLIVDKIMKGSNEKVPYLGIQMITITNEVQMIYQIPVKGVIIADVIKNSPAEKAGVQKGDIIIGVNDKKVQTSDDISEFIKSSNIGDEIKVYIYKSNGNQIELNITLSAMESTSNF